MTILPLMPNTFVGRCGKRQLLIPQGLDQTLKTANLNSHAFLVLPDQSPTLVVGSCILELADSVVKAQMVKP